jgi:hypothetical protein
MSGRRCLSCSPAGSDRFPAKVCLFIPAGLKPKLDLFERIGSKIEKAGGKVIRHDIGLIDQLPNEIIPIVGCQPESTRLIKVAAQQTTMDLLGSWLLPAGVRHMASREATTADMYRWHLNSFQLSANPGCPGRPLESHEHGRTAMAKERTAYRHCRADRTYAKFHQCESWIADTIDALARVTDRQLVIRDKESKRSLQSDLTALIAWLLTPPLLLLRLSFLVVLSFVHPDSAAALVGRTDLTQVEKPVYPDREPWLIVNGMGTLAYG